MHHDTQGARQEITLPATPATAAFLAAHKHCTEQTHELPTPPCLFQGGTTPQPMELHSGKSSLNVISRHLQSPTSSTLGTPHGHPVSHNIPVHMQMGFSGKYLQNLVLNLVLVAKVWVPREHSVCVLC